MITNREGNVSNVVAVKIHAIKASVSDSASGATKTFYFLSEEGLLVWHSQHAHQCKVETRKVVDGILNEQTGQYYVLYPVELTKLGE